MFWLITLTPYERCGVSNHGYLDCLSNSLFHLTTKSSNLYCSLSGNPATTGGFPSKRVSNGENVSIPWDGHQPDEHMGFSVGLGQQLIMFWSVKISFEIKFSITMSSLLWRHHAGPNKQRPPMCVCVCVCVCVGGGGGGGGGGGVNKLRSAND